MISNIIYTISLNKKQYYILDKFRIQIYLLNFLFDAILIKIRYIKIMLVDSLFQPILDIE